MPAPVPSSSRFRDFALLPNLAPLAQWHLLETAFQGIGKGGPSAFAPAMSGVAGYLILGRTWFLAWIMACLAAVVLGQRAATSFEQRPSDSLAGNWARRHAITAWWQAAIVGAGGVGIALDRHPESCLLVALPLGFAMVQAAASATLVEGVRGQIILLAAPLVAACLFNATPLFAAIAALFALQAAAAFSLADDAIARAQAAAQADTNHVHEPPAVHTDLAPAAADFQRLLGRDHATGLPNRHSFVHLLAQESARASRAETHLSVLMVAWDEFETFRDRHPPRELDETMALLVKRLRSRLARPADALASLGGGRFAVLLAFTDAFGAAAVARNLQCNVQSEMGTGDADGNCVDLPIAGLSIGMATYRGKGVLPENQLLQFAEEALEHARRDGPNTIRHFDPKMTTAPPPPYLEPAPAPAEETETPVKQAVGRQASFSRAPEGFDRATGGAGNAARTEETLRLE